MERAFELRAELRGEPEQVGALFSVGFLNDRIVVVEVGELLGQLESVAGLVRRFARGEPLRNVVDKDQWY